MRDLTYPLNTSVNVFVALVQRRDFKIGLARNAASEEVKESRRRISMF